MTTFTISLPDQTAHQVDSEAKRLGFASRSEFIRDLLRKEFFPKLTVNGFTEEFEEEVLRSAAEPVESDLVLETEADIDNHFRKLKNEVIRDKNTRNREIPASVKAVGL